MEGETSVGGLWRVGGVARGDEVDGVPRWLARTGRGDGVGWVSVLMGWSVGCLCGGLEMGVVLGLI